MPNDSETGVRDHGGTQVVADSSPDSSGANGYDSVAAQYSAMHEAQIAHEDGLRELREDLRVQREKLLEIGAGGGSATSGRHMEAVLLRISELERKMGEGASDPLLNEIVHRLAAIEQDGGRSGSDERVPELIARLDELKQQAAAPQADPRADDMVLRIASIEGALKRANGDESADRLEERIDALGEEFRSRQSSESDGLREQIEALGRRLEEESRNVARDAVEEVSGRVRAVEEAAGPQADPRIDEALGRIERIEAEAAEESTRERIAALEERPDAGDVEARVGGVEDKLRELVDTEIPASLGAQLRALEQQLAELSGDEDRERVETRIEAIESRLETPAEDGRLQAVEERLSGAEAAGLERNAELEQLSAASGRLEAIEKKLELWDAVSERLAEVESQLGRAVDPGRLDGMDRRIDELERHDGPVLELNAQLQSVETRIDGLTRVGGELELMAERIDRVEDQEQAVSALEGRVREMRDALAAADSGGDDPRVDELLAQIAQLEARISGVESAGRLEDDGSRFDTIEEKLRTLDDFGDLGRRLTALELSPRAGGERLDEMGQRLQLLETTQFGGAGADAAALGATVTELSARVEGLTAGTAPDLTELEERVESLERRPEDGSGESGESPELQQRLTALEEERAAVGVDAAATRELFDRVETLERGGGEGGGAAPDARVSEVLGRVANLEQSLDEAIGSAGAPAEDPRVNELAGRLIALEQGSSDGDPAAAGELAALRGRLEALEVAPAGSEALGAELNARFEDLERRLAASSGGDGGGDVQALVEKESDRWSQWARNTLVEVGELRQQIETLSEQSASAGGGQGEISAKSLESVGAAISAGLNKAEVKALRSQMYFVYFTIGMLWALGLYFLFSYVASS